MSQVQIFESSRMAAFEVLPHLFFWGSVCSPVIYSHTVIRDLLLPWMRKWQRSQMDLQ
jgi:hypothetical protein